MQNQLVPKLLRKSEARKAKDIDSGYGVSTIHACTQTDGEENEESNGISDKNTSSKSRDEVKADLENLLNSRKPKSARRSLTLERSQSQLSSTASSEWSEDESDHSDATSRQGSSKLSTMASSTTSVATNTTIMPSGLHSETRSGIRNSSSEFSTRINFTADSATSRTLHLPPVNWPGYMTRGFKFSYFQYCSK